MQRAAPEPRLRIRAAWRIATAVLVFAACGDSTSPEPVDLPGSYVLEQWHGASLPHVFRTGLHQVFVDDGAEFVMSDYVITELRTALTSAGYEVRATVIARPHDDRFPPDTMPSKLLDVGNYSYAPPRIVFDSHLGSELAFETATPTATELDVRARHRVDDSGNTTSARLRLRRTAP